jgi:chaperonin GroEL
MGVIVPTKVERVALQNAASDRGLLLTTDCAITEIKDKKDKVPAGAGMDDFDY